MRNFFYPESVVVVGVSPTPHNLGRNMIDNLHKFGYPGKIYAVGLDGGSIDGIPILPAVASLPEPVDLAAVLTPAHTLPGVLRECGDKGIHHAVVLSAGLTELSDERAGLQQEIAETAKRCGVRFIGPNGMGLICTESGLSLPFATVRRESITAGSLSILSQSGSVAFLTAWIASAEGVGLAKYVSMGNKLDTDEADLLPYFMSDAQTKTICLYLEGMARGREFVQLARTSPKPIVVLKANISEVTEHAARSHTASLASDDRVVEGAFRQAGITRVKTVRDFSTAAKVLNLPPLRGNNVGAVVSTGGISVIGADYCYRHGFHLPPLPASLLEELDRRARAKVIRLGNPIDLGDIFDTNAVLFAIEQVLALPEIDALLLSLFHFPEMPFAGPSTMEIIDRVAALGRQLQKPVLLSLMCEPQLIQDLKRQTSFPIFNDVEESLAALVMLRDYSRFRAKPPVVVTPLPVDKAAAGLIAEARHRGQRDIGPAAMAVLAGYGIPTAPLHFAASGDEAAAVASRLGYPIALKAVAPELSHKSDVGGVALDLGDAAAVRRAYGELRAAVATQLPQTDLAGMVVQRMVPGGHELILGAKQDPHFGPVVMCGLGGIFTEVLADVAFRLAPLSREEAEELIWELKGVRILQGLRGQPPADVAALATALQRLGQLIADQDDIAEIDVNPIKVLPQGQGVIAVDARIVLR